MTCVLAVLGVGILVGIGCAFKYKKRKSLVLELGGCKQEANASDMKSNQITSGSNTLKDPFADHTYEVLVY